VSAPKRPGCPLCGKPAAIDGLARPFCSPRCKMVDLGRWFQGQYVVPGEDAIALDPAEFEEQLRRLEASRLAAERDQDGGGGGTQGDA